jgi:hypothetical protein
MKAAKLTVLLILSIVLINWMRQANYSAPIPTVLPFLGGKEHSIFDAAGIVCIAIAIWGLLRLSRKRKQ